MYLLLTKYNTYYTSFLNNKLKNSYIICDEEINDELLIKNKFIGLTYSIKIPSAWDKAFFFLNNNLELLDKHSYVYFIEDDVYSKDIHTWYDLFRNLNKYDHDMISNYLQPQKDCLDWEVWSNISSYYELSNLHRSFNPVCRLSSRLIKLILNFRQKNQTFIFHEILFASLVKQYDLTYLELNQDERKKYFHIFHWRPLIDMKDVKTSKIYHPLKQDIKYAMNKKKSGVSLDK